MTFSKEAAFATNRMRNRLAFVSESLEVNDDAEPTSRVGTGVVFTRPPAPGHSRN